MRAGRCTWRLMDSMRCSQPPGDPDGGEVRFHDLLDVRPLHLDHHPRAGLALRGRCADPRHVHLSNRRRGKGDGVELDVISVQGLAELLFDHPADVIEALRADLVLEAGQLGGQLAGQHVQPRGEELPHFDEHAALAHGDHAKVGRQGAKPRRPGALGEPAEADPGQKNVPPDNAKHDAHKEPQDPPVAGLLHYW